MTNISWQTCPLSEFSNYSAEWDELNQRTINQAVMTAPFIDALIATFAQGDETVVLGRQDKKLVIAGIFAQVSSRRWQVFQPSQAPLGMFMAEPALFTDTIISDLVNQLSGTAWMVDFTQLDSKCFSYQSESAFTYMPYITTGALSVPADFEQYFASFSKNTRQNINKAKNRLKKEGVDIRLDIITAPEQITEFVKTYGEIESKSWKSALGTAVNLANEQGQFYQQMLQQFALSQQAQIWCYRFDEQVVAVDLCVVHQETITILKTTFDQEFARYSPALIMKVDAYQQMSEQGGIKQIEYYGKVMDWHRRLKCEEREIFHVTWCKYPAIYRLLTKLKAKLKK